MTAKQISDFPSAPQALADSDIVAAEQEVSGVWTTCKITLLALYNYILGKLNTAGRLLPAGGTTDQLLGKISNSDYAVSWRTVLGLPTPNTGGLDDGKFVKYDGGGTWVYDVPPDQSAGSTSQIQHKASGGGFAGAARAEIDANGSLRLVVGSSPATPAAGKLTSHAAYLGALEYPAWVNSASKQYLAQPLLAGKRFVSTTALIANGSRLHVGIADTFVGASAAAFTPTFADLPNSMVKTNLTSSAPAGSSASLYYGALYCSRGASAGAGGFTLRYLWHPNDVAAVADARCFVGLYAATTSIGNVNPSTLLNIIGVGADNGESGLSIMHNDGSGTATKISLGATSFPQSDTSKVYELILHAEPNDSVVHYQVRELGSGAIARGSINSNLPAADQGLTHHLWRNNGATALAVRVGFGYVYNERDL